MLTDADWNELVDILKGRLNEALKDVVGNGSPLHRNIVNNDTTPPKLEWGALYIDGIQALVRPDRDAASPVNFEYERQEDFPQPPPIVPANHVLYADVWERTVTQLMDERLRDIGLHGADTCTRKQVMAQIKWCPEGIDPESAAENPRKGNARVSVTLLKKSTEPDPCDPCAKQLDVKSGVGNYLFRIEVHDVRGPANNPDEITLKWSTENGAIQAGVVDGDVSAHFRAGNRAYEFFDQTSERHLGVHLDNVWQPVRAEMSETFVVPSDAGKPNQYVRRWDGFCILKKVVGNWTVEQQYGNEEGASFVEVAGNEATIELSSLRVLVGFDTGIVAGDHWLAEVRENAHEPDDVLIEAALPDGIEHHYLTLGKVVGGVLQDNPEADRKYAFPPLTEMTHMFIAGGDGQEVVPGEALPQPLRVAVGNGEWPVTGAQVRFQAVAEDETLTLLAIVDTDNNGIAKYLWTPDAALDAFLKVRATLVDPDDPDIDLSLPPLYFSANLVSADQVAYEPQCPPDDEANTVHHLLLGPDSTRLGTDGYYTVKEVLDALLCELGAAHIPYDDPGCATTPTDTPSVLSLLAGLDNNGDDHVTVKDVLDTLLCRLTAEHVPLNKADTDLCPDLKNDPQVNTVQDALRVLCDRETGGGSCCTIVISPGDDIAEKLAVLSGSGVDAHICIAHGKYLLREPVRIEKCGHITLQGCGDGSFIEAPNRESVLIFEDCKSVIVRDLSLRSGALGSKDAGYDHLNGALTIRNVEKVVVENVTLMCAAGDKKMGSCLTIFHPVKTASVIVRDCHLKPGAHQLGMLLVNVDRAQIDGNEVKVRLQNRKHSFKRRMQDRGFRLSIRKRMLVNVDVVSGVPQSTGRNTDTLEIAYGRNRKLRLQTQPELVSAWNTYFDSFSLPTGYNDRDLVNYVKDQADRILLDPGTPEGDSFNRWVNNLKQSLPAIAAQGIVCAGRVANDITVSGNVIVGVNQGIHIGLSHRISEESEPDIAGRLMVSGNRVVNFQSAQMLGGRHGIYIGNFDCLHIENNHLMLEVYSYDITPAATGIHVFGYFGDMLQIRGNRTARYNKGIYARAVNTVKTSLWKVEGNLLTDGSSAPDLNPGPIFITEHNVNS